MNRLLTLLSICLAAGTLCFGQTANPPQRHTKDDIEIPLPLSSPRAFRPGTEPLTAKEKAELAVKNIFLVRPIASRALLAGWDTLWNNQPEWPGGAEGYGMRLGNRMGSQAVRQSIQLAADTAFHTEPRYDLCECTSAKGRLRHALRRVYLSRTDAGGEMLSASRLGSAFITPWITHNWLPDSDNTTSQKLTSAGTNLAMRALGNVLREFWPDISRKAKLPKMLRKERPVQPKDR